MSARSRRKQGKLAARRNARIKVAVRQLQASLEGIITKAIGNIMEQIAFPYAFMDAALKEADRISGDCINNRPK